MTRIDIENRLLQTQPAAAPQAAAGSGQKFGQILQSQIAGTAHGIKFSAHAQTRLASRQISLSSDELKRLGEAMTRAGQKGARESLALLDKVALVVSIPNRTVITAVDKAALKDNIFTNIDSAMIV